MRNMLAFLAAAALVLVGVGWYLGWYSVQTSTNAKGNHDISIEVHDDKAKADVKKGIVKGEKELQDIAEKNRQNSDKAGSGSTQPPGLLPVPQGSGSSGIIALPPFTINTPPNR